MSLTPAALHQFTGTVHVHVHVIGIPETCDQVRNFLDPLYLQRMHVTSQVGEGQAGRLIPARGVVTVRTACA